MRVEFRYSTTARAILTIALAFSFLQPVKAESSKIKNGIWVSACSTMLVGLAVLAVKNHDQSKTIQDAKAQISALTSQNETQAEELKKIQSDKEVEAAQASEREDDSKHLAAFLSNAMSRFNQSLAIASQLKFESLSIYNEETDSFLDNFCSSYEDLIAATKKEESMSFSLAGPERKTALVEAANAQRLIDENAELYSQLKTINDRWDRVTEVLNRIQKLESQLKAIDQTITELEPIVIKLEVDEPNSEKAIEARSNIDSAKALKMEVEAELLSLKSLGSNPQ
jgi:hypothetical protein